MLGRHGRCWRGALPLVVCAFLGSPASAWAASGLYLQLGAGYGEWTGQELVTSERPGEGDLPVVGEGCCPSGTFSAQLRLGLSIFGIAPEVVAFGSGWNLDADDTAGGGFFGGGLRLFPLDLLDALEVFDNEDFPLDVSVAASAGYAVVGSDAFSYEGWAFGFDIGVEYILASFFSVGLKTDFWFPSYDPFVLTSSSNNTGRCLDGSAQQIVDNSQNPSLPTDGVINRDDRGLLCPGGGRGPNTTVISPQIYMTFRFDIFE